MIIVTVVVDGILNVVVQRFTRHIVIVGIVGLLIVGVFDMINEKRFSCSSLNRSPKGHRRFSYDNL